MALVGATIVGINVWSGTVTPPAGKAVNVWNYSTDTQPITLKKGEEMDVLNLAQRLYYFSNTMLLSF